MSAVLLARLLRPTAARIAVLLLLLLLLFC
jgi:hypothetical protein